MCRAGGRRCPSHSNPTKIAARNARRRATYAVKKHGNPTLETQLPEVVENALTKAQTQYFQNSKARDENGQLVKVYHGSGVEFNEFNPATLGRGNDSWGNGFYFTNLETTAQGYANDTGSPTANVKEFYVNLTNPLLVDGKEYMSLNHLTVNMKQASAMLRQHPDIYRQPDDEDESNPLGDYAPEFWDREHHTKEQIDRMIDKVAEEYFNNASWPEMEGFFGREHGAAYLKALSEQTGYDGVIVDFGEDGKHYVSWFPEQMKLTSNTTPTHTTTF